MFFQDFEILFLIQPVPESLPVYPIQDFQRRQLQRFFLADQKFDGPVCKRAAILELAYGWKFTRSA